MSLRDRVSGKVIHSNKPGPKPYLSPVKEKELANYLVEVAKAGYGKSRSQIKGLAEAVGLASSSPLGPIPSASSSSGESTNIPGITAPSDTAPLMCEPKSTSLNTGSVVHTPGLHSPSPVPTSVAPTPPHSCGSKSPSQYWLHGSYTWIAHILPCCHLWHSWYTTSLVTLSLY